MLPKLSPVLPTRLSSARLWSLQREYFEREGPRAWESNTVPSYVTCNPTLAWAYAHVLLAMLRDEQAHRDANEPLEIIELGAGSGRFAFLLLRALDQLLPRTRFAGLPVRYIATDFTERNVRAWESHPALRTYLDRGALDTAVFDLACDPTLVLRNAGRTITPASLRSRVAVIANYVFDSVPADVLRFERGAVFERLVEHDPDAPLDAIALRWSSRDTTDAPFDVPALDALVRTYAATLDEATVVLPTVALSAIERVARWSQRGALVLAADHGPCTLHSLRGSGDPTLLHHGSVSLATNFHAIGAYARARGGDAVLPSHAPTYLTVGACWLDDAALEHTRLAIDEWCARSGPDDAYALRKQLRAVVDAMPIEHALALVRASRWDPSTMMDALPALWRAQPTAPVATLDAVIDAIARCADNVFTLASERDVLFELALLAYGCGDHGLAITLFERSSREHGPDARTQWNIGLCHFAMGAIERATERFAEAARVEPGFVPAGGMQIKS